MKCVYEKWHQNAKLTAKNTRTHKPQFNWFGFVHKPEQSKKMIQIVAYLMRFYCASVFGCADMRINLFAGLLKMVANRENAPEIGKLESAINK